MGINNNVPIAQPPGINTNASSGPNDGVAPTLQLSQGMKRDSGKIFVIIVIALSIHFWVVWRQYKKNKLIH